MFSFATGDEKADDYGEERPVCTKHDAKSFSGLNEEVYLNLDCTIISVFSYCFSNLYLRQLKTGPILYFRSC